MPFPFISAVIPTFNRLGMVERAVRSVLAQTYPSFECIVVDDGSTDNTFQALQQEFGDRIRLFKKENGGVSSARNLGIQESRGEWIAFLDSDDEWFPAKLERQMAHVKAHPACRIVQTTEQWTRQGRRVNPGLVHLKKGGDLFEASLHRCMITPSSVLMKKSLFGEVGLFDEAMIVCEDYDIWLRITSRMEVGLVEEDLMVRHGGRSDQLSAGHSLDKYRIDAIKKLLAGTDLNPDHRALAEKVLKDKSRIYGKGCLRRGREREAAAYLALAGEEHHG